MARLRSLLIRQCKDRSGTALRYVNEVGVSGVGHQIKGVPSFECIQVIASRR